MSLCPILLSFYEVLVLNSGPNNTKLVCVCARVCVICSANSAVLCIASSSRITNVYARAHCRLADMLLPPPPPQSPPLCNSAPPWGGTVTWPRKHRPKAPFLQGSKGAEADLHCDTMVQICHATPPPWGGGTVTS